ncbi:hypothetical protein EBQ74_10750 [bacterium]|nr:hypothetical protein [bacterium]
MKSFIQKERAKCNSLGGVMTNQGMKIGWLKVVVTAAVFLSLISCSKSSSPRSAEESNLLENSIFNPGEKAPGVEQGAQSEFQQGQESILASISVFSFGTRTSDGGYIPGSPSGSGSGSDTGSIPIPGSVVTSTTLPAGSLPDNSASVTTLPLVGSVPSTGQSSSETTIGTDTGSSGTIDGGILPGEGTVSGGTDQGYLPGGGSYSGTTDSGNLPSSGGGSQTSVDNGSLPASGGDSQTTVDNGTLPTTGGGSQTSVDNGTLPTTGGGSQTSVDNGTLPTTGGGSQTTEDSHDDSCTCHNSVHPTPCSPRKKRVTVNLGRVCSIRRSRSLDLFFEEAQNPILSIEAIVPKGRVRYGSQSSNPYSNPGTIEQWGVLSPETKLKDRFLISVFDLKGIDLISGKQKRSLEIDTTALRRKLGRDWTKAAFVASVCDDPNRDGSCYATSKGMLLSVVPAVFKANRIPSQIALDIWSGRGYSQSQDGDVCDKQYSPVVLDLTGEGIFLSAPEEGLKFDLNDDGSEIYTGWIRGRNNAFLVRDINNNGQIDNGSELFGSATKLLNGKRAANGFEALKDLDSNHDGFLTSKDAQWRSLRLWFDRNFDGFSQHSEIDRLEQYQVKSINLNYIELLEMDEHGNQTRERSTYTRRIRGKDTPLLAVDIWFRTLIDQ